LLSGSGTAETATLSITAPEIPFNALAKDKVDSAEFAVNESVFDATAALLPTSFQLRCRS
jgi:hypothetical protein